MTKERLKAYKDIKLEHDNLVDDLRELEEELYSLNGSNLDGMPRGGSGPGNPTANKAVKHADHGYTEIIAEYRRKVAELGAELLEIENAIKALRPRERTLIRLHYIKGLTWEEVCIAMSYSWRQVHRIHAAALEALREKEETNA